MAQGTPAFPASGNVFVKDHRATNGLIVDFSRNPSQFALNKYAQIKGVAKEAGYFLKMTVEECGRILNTDLSDFVWADGQERPLRNEGDESFLFQDYKTQRYDYGFNLGDKAVNQADWDIVGTHSRIHAQQAMTARTQLAKTMLDTIGDGSLGGSSTHTSAVASITGNTGNWGQSTTQRQDIKRSFNYAAQLILQDTLSAIDETSLIVVMPPAVAIEMSECQEIVDHVKHSETAIDQIRGDGKFKNPNARFGLPLQLYGCDIVVDATYKTTSKKGATAAKEAVLGTNVAYMVARPGDLVAPSGGPSFSTLTLLALEEMTVETLRDERNRRVEGHVVDDICLVLTAPVTGFRFTSAV